MTRLNSCVAIFAVASAVAMVGSARAAPVESLPWARGGGCMFAEPQCAIRIRFGSVCCGPDRETGDAVTSYIAASSDIEKAIKCPYGKEGEYELCLVFSDKAKARSIFDALSPLIPAPGSGPSSRGNTLIEIE